MRNFYYKIIFVFATGLTLSLSSIGQKKEVIADVFVYSYGCFIRDTTRLVLTKYNNQITAELEEQRKPIRTATVTHDQFKKFEVFIKHLQRLKQQGSCTSIDIYKVTYKNKIIEKFDGGCEWSGFNKLLIELYPN